MKGITISRGYIRLIDNKEEFFIGTEFWNQLRTAITTAKRMKRKHQGRIKTIVIHEGVKP